MFTTVTIHRHQADQSILYTLAPPDHLSRRGHASLRGFVWRRYGSNVHYTDADMQQPRRIDLTMACLFVSHGQPSITGSNVCRQAASVYIGLLRTTLRLY